ncbi:MAG TPA: tape measure protein [Rhizobium sp.]|nr:tape measure protein [Rhizobium sp.]
MAKRDVELVIRAKDQAKATIQSVAGALEDLAKTQKDVGQSAQQTDGLLGRLGAEFKNLNAQVQGLQAFSKVATQIDKATAALTRLEAETKTAEGNAASFAAAYTKAAATLSKVEQQGRLAVAALERQKAATLSAKAAQEQINAEILKAQERYRNLVAAIRNTKGPSDELRNSVRQQANELFALFQRQQQANAAFSAQSAALKTASSAFKEVQTAIRSAAESERKLGDEARDAAEGLTAQKAALGAAKSEFNELKTAAAGVSQTLGGVAAQEAAIGTASQRAAADLAKVTEALQKQNAVAKGSGGNATSSPAAQATAAFRAQQQAVRDTQKAWQDAQATVKNLAKDMFSGAQATAELRTQFVLAQSASKQAKAEYLSQAEAMNRLRGITQGSFAAFDKMAVSMEKEAAAARSAEAANNTLVGRLRTLLNSLLGVGPAAQSAGNALAKAGDGAVKMGRGIQTAGENSRRSLSLFQRLRGEVLGLTASFVGLFSAISASGDVIKSFRTLEAAQSRLGVVFNQDLGAVSQEMQFLSRESSRLGLNFGVLADEYSKFSVAAQTANFTTEDTRTLFTQVAEAARVNKLSVEQLEGVFLALTQMMSKGKVTSEELRRQLGDRLTGAFNIFASALGLTTAELDAAMQAGEVFADRSTLLKFGDELARRFGPQLAKSLETTTTQIDRFQNNLFKAQLTVAKGGFIDALTRQLLKLNEGFQSREGRDFFLSLGAALGKLVDILGFALDNTELVALAFKAFLSVRVGQFVLGLVQSFQQLAASTALTAAETTKATVAQKGFVAALLSGQFGTIAAAFVGLRTAVAGVGAGFTVAGVQAKLFTGVMVGLRSGLAAVTLGVRGLFAALGGLPGLIITAVSFAATEVLGKWLTQIPLATRALDEHERQVELVTAAYQEATDKTDGWQKSIKGVRLDQADRNLEDLVKSFRKAQEDVARAATDIGKTGDKINAAFNSNTDYKTLNALNAAFVKNQISAREFQAGLETLYRTTKSDAIRKLASDMLKASDKSAELEKAIGQQAIVAQQLGSKHRDLKKFIDASGLSFRQLTGDIDSSSNALADAAEKAKNYQSSIESLKSFVPKLKAELDKAADSKAIQDAFSRGIENASSDDEKKQIAALRDQALAAVASKKTGGGSKSNPQAEFNKSVQEGIDARKFEVRLLSETLRQQEILRALNEAEVDAKSRGVKFTQAQRDAVRESAAAEFDAKQAIEAGLKIREAERELVKLQKADTDELSRSEFISDRAKQEGVDLITEQGRKYAELLGLIFDVNEAKRKQKKLEEDSRDALADAVGLEQQRRTLLDELQVAKNEADKDRVAAIQDELKGIQEQLVPAVEKAREFATALGDEKAIAQLDKISLKLETITQKIVTAKEINQSAAQGLTSAFEKSADAVGMAIDGTLSWGNALRNVGDAFRQFASDFLRQIANMIAQQAILNALQGGGFGKGVSGFVNGLFAHTGAVVGGRGGRKKPVRPEWFANATRFHGGGLPGLKQNEVPAVLKKGEEVLSENDPRNVLNGGKGSGGGVKIVNAFDAGSFLSESLNSDVGGKTLVNHVRANKTAIRQALGV